MVNGTWKRSIKMVGSFCWESSMGAGGPGPSNAQAQIPMVPQAQIPMVPLGNRPLDYLKVVFSFSSQLPPFFKVLFCHSHSRIIWRWCFHVWRFLFKCLKALFYKQVIGYTIQNSKAMAMIEFKMFECLCLCKETIGLVLCVLNSEAPFSRKVFQRKTKSLML